MIPLWEDTRPKQKTRSLRNAFLAFDTQDGLLSLCQFSNCNCAVLDRRETKRADVVPQADDVVCFRLEVLVDKAGKEQFGVDRNLRIAE